MWRGVRGEVSEEIREIKCSLLRYVEVRMRKCVDSKTSCRRMLCCAVLLCLAMSIGHVKLAKFDLTIHRLNRSPSQLPP
jgi:hypothetical protein